MYKLSVMYPNQEDAQFDFDYYRTKHMDLVQANLSSFGLIKTEVDKGISGGGEQPAPYICVGNLYFESKEGFDKGMADVGAILRADIPKFTNVTPIRQISEILD
ncbi:MAG: EthD family reductase [Desulfobacterales bacterium]